MDRRIPVGRSSCTKENKTVAKQLFIERRAQRRPEAPQVERSAAEEKQERTRQQERRAEVAELENSTDEVLADIDEVLAMGIGQVSIQAA